jgi:acetyl esterase/lipase
MPEKHAPSRSSRVLAGLSALTLRPIGACVPANAAGVRFARSVAELFLPLLAPAPRGRAEPVRTHWEDRAVSGDWIEPAGSPDSDSVLLYLHGSGYVACSPRTHRGLVSQLCSRARVPAFVPDYRLAPQYRYPAANEDALAAYRWLESLGYTPDRIVVAGDSAGGHLAMGLCLGLRELGSPPPAGLVMFSPLADATFATAAERDGTHHDPYFTAKLGRRMLALYGRDGDPADPRFAVLGCGEADAAALPPLLVHAGGSEALAADAEAICEFVGRAGGDCRMRIWPGQAHVFQILYRFVPEAREALDEAAGFVRERLAATRTRREGARPDAYGHSGAGRSAGGGTAG